jgi:hypothetical protein
MEWSPFWEADSRSLSQEISCLLWNSEIHYCVHKNRPLDTFLRLFKPVHTITLDRILQKYFVVFLSPSNQIRAIDSVAK